MEFFNEKLNLPVEYFNPLSQVVIGKGVDTELLQREAHTMGELIGLGLRGIGKSTINIDLVPAAVEVTRAADRRKPYLIAASVLLILGFALWAVLQHMAAGKAEDRNRTMGEIRENLSPVETQIRSLLNKEQELSEIAGAYTTIEANHSFWFDLMGELRGAFSHDAVWITEMTPLYGYNALPPEEGAAPAAQPVVKPEFASTQSNASAIAEPRTDAATAAKGGSRGNRNQQVEPTEPIANALLVRGFWRENSRSQNVVSDLLKRLRENSETFRFTGKDSKSQEVTLSDEQILRISVAGEEGDLGFPFELTLPLAREVKVK